MRENKIYLVKFNEPIDGQNDFIFGSLAAIYDHFTDNDIGCKVERLWSIGVAKGKEYRSDRCSIKAQILMRKTTKRGRSKK